MINIKQYDHFTITLEQAKKLAIELDTETNAIKNKYITTHKQLIKESVGNMIDNIVVDVIREGLKKEIYM